MKAIAILHVDPEVAETALEGVSLTKLDDCVLLPLGVSLASEPALLGARLRELAGPVVDLHREEKGVPLIPDSLKLEATTWTAAIEELGEAADWVVPAAENPMAGMEGLLGALGGAGMPADMSALLQGEQGAALLEQAMQMAQQMAQTGALEDFAKAMSAPETIAAPPPEDMPEIDPAIPAPPALDASALAEMGLDPAVLQGANPENMDMEAMAKQAQAMLGGLDLNAMAAQAQSMLEANPELEAQLREQLGGAMPGAAESGEETSEDDGEGPDTEPPEAPSDAESDAGSDEGSDEPE